MNPMGIFIYLFILCYTILLFVSLQILFNLSFLKGHLDFRFRSDRRLVPWSSPKTIGGFSPSRHVCVSVFWLWYLYRYIYIHTWYIYIYTYMWGSYPKVSKLMITVILCHIKCLKFIRMFFTDEIVDCVLFLDPGKGWYSFYEVDGLSSKVLCTMLNISCLTLKYVQFVHVNIYIIPNMVGNQSKINTSNLFIPPGQ